MILVYTLYTHQLTYRIWLKKDTKIDEDQRSMPLKLKDLSRFPQST